MKRSYIILIGAIVIAVLVWFIERPDKFDVGDFAPFKLYKDLAGKGIDKIEVEHLLSGSILTADGDVWRVSELETEIGKQIKESKKEGKGTSELPQFKADTEKVKGIIEKLDKLTAQSLVSTNPEKQSTYQVGKLAKHLRAFDSQNNVVLDLYIGKNGPDMFTTYVRREGEDEVYLVGEHIGAAIPADVMSWRDKEIWDYPPDFITGVSVRKRGKEASYSISKDEEGKWHLREPNEMELNTEKVKGLVKELASISANRFAFIFDKGETGLNDPSLELEVTTTGGGKNTLMVGKEDKQGYLYARLKENSEEIYLLSSNFGQKVPSDWKELVSD